MSRAAQETDSQVSAALNTVSRWQDENARLIAERDEAREHLATCRERNAAIAVQLDQYRDERDRYRAALERIRDESPSHGYGWHARIAREALEGGGDASS